MHPKARFCLWNILRHLSKFHQHHYILDFVNLLANKGGISHYDLHHVKSYALLTTPLQSDDIVLVFVTLEDTSTIGRPTSFTCRVTSSIASFTLSLLPSSLPDRWRCSLIIPGSSSDETSTCWRLHSVINCFILITTLPFRIHRSCIFMSLTRSKDSLKGLTSLCCAP
jgi:hypothetical protein